MFQVVVSKMKKWRDKTIPKDLSIVGLEMLIVLSFKIVLQL